MKETIAKANKEDFKFMFVLSLISVATTLSLLRIPSIRIIATVCATMMLLASLLLLIVLIDPRPAIERNGDTLIIRRGLFYKKQIDIKNISNVFLTPDPKKQGAIIKSSISIKAIVDTEEKIIDCFVINPTEIVEKINTLRKGSIPTN